MTWEINVDKATAEERRVILEMKFTSTLIWIQFFKHCAVCHGDFWMAKKSFFFCNTMYIHTRPRARWQNAQEVLVLLLLLAAVPERLLIHSGLRRTCVCWWTSSSSRAAIMSNVGKTSLWRISIYILSNNSGSVKHMPSSRALIYQTHLVGGHFPGKRWTGWRASKESQMRERQVNSDVWCLDRDLQECSIQSQLNYPSVNRFIKSIILDGCVTRAGMCVGLRERSRAGIPSWMVEGDGVEEKYWIEVCRRIIMVYLYLHKGKAMCEFKCMLISFFQLAIAVAEGLFFCRGLPHTTVMNIIELFIIQRCRKSYAGDMKWKRKWLCNINHHSRRKEWKAIGVQEGVE